MAIISYAQQQILARDDDFRIQVRQAALTKASEVLVEPATESDETTWRLNLARQSFSAPIGEADRLAYILATKSPYPAGSTSITDALVLSIVSDNWTMLAGYNPNITP